MVLVFVLNTQMASNVPSLGSAVGVAAVVEGVVVVEDDAVMTGVDDVHLTQLTNVMSVVNVVTMPMTVNETAMVAKGS